ncbi:dynamin family protein [Thiomonas bhubaneswarensis]|uniref:Dynamin family n=1 Tax=Thiomonas bhubaneswarensis TaxID=339866 RepID=A0A0K6HXT9_9BURK|nr:dynamin family protein [Thiomonas bhubaneswarensis]CUA95729.1 Dynamin family [Thiomonas bhubaneswarensis]
MNPHVETPILTAGLFDYAEWRAERLQRVKSLLVWLEETGLDLELARPVLQRQITRLDHDRMTLAFVAEFSRGKSELINAIFFSGHGQRILPAGAGRTTMCPMELFSDPSQPRGLRLLPIDTRLQSQTLAQWKSSPQVWTYFELPSQDAQGLAQALTHLSDTQRVPLERAQELGFFHDAEELAQLTTDADGEVEIPLWRHALVNFAHPLLDQGLSILDTPGLNAVGAEPELTLSLIPSANAVVFVLGADTGVTRSDLDIWNRHIAPASGAQTLVALNKVDSLWDPLLTAPQISASIDHQVQTTAATLRLPVDRVFPVSAHKALLARIQGDGPLLARSGLGALENALNRAANIDRRGMLDGALREAVEQVQTALDQQLRQQLHDTQGQLDELLGLRGKNANMVVLMLQRLSAERSEFDAGMAQVLALRAVNNRMLEKLRERFASKSVLQELEQLESRMGAAVLKLGVKGELTRIGAELRNRLVEAETQIEEIRQMLAAAFTRANSEFGFTVSAPRVLRLNGLMQEFDRAMHAYTEHLSGVNWLKLQNNAYTLRTLRGLSSRVRDLFERALRDIENWDRSAIAQLDSQVRERKKQLNRRLATLQRIEDTKDSLHDRINELRAQVEHIGTLQRGLNDQLQRVRLG